MSSTPMARSYPKRSRQSTGTAGTSNARRGGGRPRRSAGGGDLANATGGNNSMIDNYHHHGENYENDDSYDYNFENAVDGDHGTMGSGGGTSFVPSSSSSSHTFLPKRRKTNAASTSRTTSSSANQRWVKVHRRPMAPTNEPYFGSSPFASFTVPTWVKLQDLTKEERANYDDKTVKEMEKKKHYNNDAIESSQAGERRDGSGDGSVVEVVAVSPATEIVCPTNEEGGVNPSADCAMSADPASKDAKEVEDTDAPLNTMNLEDLKQDDSDKQKVEDGGDTVDKVPMESSMSMVEGGDNEHGNEYEIIYNDHVGDNESEDLDDYEEGEIEEDYQETN